MSLLSKAFRKIVPKEIRGVAAQAAPIVGGIYGGPLGATIGTAIGSSLVGGRGSAPAVTIPGAGLVPVQAASLNPVIIKKGAEVAKDVAIGAGGVLAGSSFFGGGKRKYRRMDYGNMKAARRAIRRIKGTRRMLQKIERELPKRTVRSRSSVRHVPTRYAHRA